MNGKKKFIEPLIYPVELNLTTRICNCDAMVTYVDSAICDAGYDGDAYLLNQTYGLFGDSAYCTEIPEDGEVFTNSICYHTSSSSVFAS